MHRLSVHSKVTTLCVYTGHSIQPFTILDGSENPNSPGGNHVIALLNSQEKYKYLSEAVKDIASDIKSIKSLTIDGQNFNFNFFMCADMKYLAICAGIQVTNATFHVCDVNAQLSKDMIPQSHGVP